MAAVQDPPSNSSSSYIQTTTNSYVSRAASVEGPRFVEIKGRSIIQDGAKICGNVAPIRIGRYCLLDTNCTVEPPTLPVTNKPVPVTIGAHTAIGADSNIQAAAIGSLCSVGRNVNAGPRSIVKDCCVIADDTVIPADTLIPPFHRAYTDVGGRFCTMELPPSVAVELQERATNIYHDFVAAQKGK